MINKYAIGQVWEYRTREGEADSRLHIAGIDHEVGDDIYHIYIDGLRMKSPFSITGIASELGHAPVTREVLDASVTRLLSLNLNPPDISEGYAAWRQAYESGNAGVFSVQVREIVGFIESAVVSAAQG